MEACSEVPTVILLVNGQGGPHSLLFKRLLRLKLTSWILNIIGYCILAVSVVGAIMFGISFGAAGAACYAVAVPLMTLLPVCVLMQRLIQAMAVKKDQTTFPPREVLLPIRNRSVAALVVTLVTMLITTPLLTAVTPVMFAGHGVTDNPDGLSTGVMLVILLMYIYIPATWGVYIPCVVVTSMLVHSSKRALRLVEASVGSWSETPAPAPAGSTAAAPAGSTAAEQHGAGKV